MLAKWRLMPQSPDLAGKLSRQLEIHRAVAQALVNRGLFDAASAERFCNPELSDLIHPFSLSGVEPAAECLARAIAQNRKIGVYADYDADGITAAALLINFLTDLGQEPAWYLPDRLSQGYGLHREGIEFLASQGVSFLVTADCGTTDLEQIKHARRLGLEVLVTDHHQLGPMPPESQAFVNPQGPEVPEHFKNLAGVGVVFFVLAGCRIKLREIGFFNGRPEPNLKHYLDLVALGTLADVVSVTGQNRIILKAGLDLLSLGERPSLAALARAARLKAPFSSRDVLFGLVPRLNAAGRLGQADLGLKLLTTQDQGQADWLARELNSLNSRRQRLEQKVMAEALKTLLAQGDPTAKRSLVVAGRGWHQGVLGIVASRLVRRFHRPCFVCSIEGQLATGSGRSIEAFHLHQGLKSLAPLLIRFGGHSQAAGMRLEAKLIDRFAQALEGEVGRSLNEADLIPQLRIDSSLNLDDLDSKLVNDLERLSPFGQGNPEPLFLADRIGLLKAWTAGDRGDHLGLILRQGQQTWSAIGFGLGHLAESLPASVKIAYRPVRDLFRGKERIKLHIADIQPA